MGQIPQAGDILLDSRVSIVFHLTCTFPAVLPWLQPARRFREGPVRLKCSHAACHCRLADPEAFPASAGLSIPVVESSAAVDP